MSFRIGWGSWGSAGDGGTPLGISGARGGSSGGGGGWVPPGPWAEQQDAAGKGWAGGPGCPHARGTPETPDWHRETPPAPRPFPRPLPRGCPLLGAAACPPPNAFISLSPTGEADFPSCCTGKQNCRHSPHCWRGCPSVCQSPRLRGLSSSHFSAGRFEVQHPVWHFPAGPLLA